jgi:hypothetical protein
MPVAKRIGDLPGFWQPRFYDFKVYSHEKKNEKLDYMHANPVNRGSRLGAVSARLAVDQLGILLPE